MKRERRLRSAATYRCIINNGRAFPGDLSHVGLHKKSYPVSAGRYQMLEKISYSGKTVGELPYFEPAQSIRVAEKASKKSATTNLVFELHRISARNNSGGSNSKGGN